MTFDAQVDFTIAGNVVTEQMCYVLAQNANNSIDTRRSVCNGICVTPQLGYNISTYMVSI